MWKKSLINSLINAYCGIKLQDNFRYIITDESQENLVDKGITKNNYVTIYNIESFNDNPPITIIDTPGFGAE